MLVTLKDILGDAKKKHYAVGLFNTVNLEMAKGVLAAAQELRAPVILGTAEVLLPYASLEELSYFLRPMAQKASVPVVLHFDHGMTEKCVKKAMDLGFTSVMYDCSTLEYADNMERVREMAGYAHERGASIEAELGHVAGGETQDGGEGIFTDPDQAERYAEYTGIDALAVAIGTVHGEYRRPPQLQYSILKQICSRVNIPLVLHGGSGLSDEEFRHAIAEGIAKVNIFTDINKAAARAAGRGYKEGAGYTDLMCPIAQAVKQETMKKMLVFGCDGRA